jgi:hypothetical protein
VPAEFFFGAMSPYSWFAAERIDSLLPDAQWRPVYAGGLFRANDRSSWGLGETRQAGIAECEARAAAYGLGKIRWPEPWRCRAGGGRLPRSRQPSSPRSEPPAILPEYRTKSTEALRAGGSPPGPAGYSRAMAVTTAYSDRTDEQKAICEMGPPIATWTRHSSAR